jgi:hypothetical protein
MDSYDRQTLAQIQKLESKEIKTEEDVNNIADLKKKLTTFRINSFENTTKITSMKTTRDAEISATLENKGLTLEGFMKYQELKNNQDNLKSNFNGLLSEVNVTS